MNLTTIDRQKCKQCGLCAKACPVGIVVLADGFPTTVEKIEKGCITCGHCVAACPTTALSHSRMTAQDCEPLAADWRSTPGQVEQLIKGRRSIRRFRRDPVDRETIAKLLEIARYAPTGMNTQTVHWLVILDPRQLEWLAAEVVEWFRSLTERGMHGAKGILKAWDLGQDPILRKAPHLIVAHGAVDDPIAPSSATIALATLDLAAQSFGLGACWAGFLHQAANGSPDVSNELGLPEGHRMCGGLMIGYPEIQYSRIPARKPAQVTWR